MSIDHHHPTILHPAWCAPDRHDYVGALDQWHRSDIHTVEPIRSLTDDPDLVEVGVEQYSGRLRGSHEWKPSRPAVLLRTLRPGGSNLTPHEARQVGRQLLAAADIAEGVAVTW